MEARQGWGENLPNEVARLTGRDEAVGEARKRKGPVE